MTDRKRVYLSRLQVDMLGDVIPHVVHASTVEDKIHTEVFEPAVPRCGEPRCFWWYDPPPLGDEAFCDHPIPIHDCPPDGSGYCHRHSELRKDDANA
jgi:hypothetical protein